MPVSKHRSRKKTNSFGIRKLERRRKETAEEMQHRSSRSSYFAEESASIYTDLIGLHMLASRLRKGGK
jgi:hypothetical protein